MTMDQVMGYLEQAKGMINGFNTEYNLGRKIDRNLEGKDELWWLNVFQWNHTSIYAQIEALKLKGIL